MMVLDNPDPIQAEADFGCPVKQCISCHEWLPADPEFFYRQARSRDGLDAPCKVCWMERERTRDKPKRAPYTPERRMAMRLRLTTINEEQAAMVLAELEKGGSRSACCKAVGIANSTFYNWMKIPDFAQRVMEAEERGRMAQSKANEKVKAQAIAYLRAGKSWRRTAALIHVDHTTLYRWMVADEAFRDEVYQVQEEARRVMHHV